MQHEVDDHALELHGIRVDLLELVTGTEHHLGIGSSHLAQQVAP